MQQADWQTQQGIQLFLFFLVLSGRGLAPYCGQSLSATY